MKKLLLGGLLTAFLCSTATASGLEIKRIGDEPKRRFSEAIWAGDTLYISGIMADPDQVGDPVQGTPTRWHGDTKSQAINTLQKISKILAAQGLSMGDCVQMVAFLAADPTKGEMDFDGWNAAYAQFFGTPEQPARPVRATVQVAKLVGQGGLIEVMVTAVRPKK